MFEEETNQVETRVTQLTLILTPGETSLGEVQVGEEEEEEEEGPSSARPSLSPPASPGGGHNWVLIKLLFHHLM